MSDTLNRVAQVLEDRKGAGADSVIGVDPNWLFFCQFQAVQRYLSAPNLEAMIIDFDGKVLYPEILAGEQMPPASLRAPSGWTSGHGYVSASVAVPSPSNTNLSWYIMVRQPLDIALQPARVLLYKLLILGVLAAIVFGLVAYYLASSLSRPIERLAWSASTARSEWACMSMKPGAMMRPETSRTCESPVGVPGCGLRTIELMRPSVMCTSAR